MAIEQYKMEVLPGTVNGESTRDNGKVMEIRNENRERDDRRDDRYRRFDRDRDRFDSRQQSFFRNQATVNKVESGKFKELLDDLVGTKGAYILDEKLNVLGKVPVSELYSAVRGLPSSHAIILDGIVDRSTASIGERANVKIMVGMGSRVRPGETRVKVLSKEEL